MTWSTHLLYELWGVFCCWSRAMVFFIGLWFSVGGSLVLFVISSTYLKHLSICFPFILKPIVQHSKSPLNCHVYIAF